MIAATLPELVVTLCVGLAVTAMTVVAMWKWGGLG